MIKVGVMDICHNCLHFQPKVKENELSLYDGVGNKVIPDNIMDTEIVCVRTPICKNAIELYKEKIWRESNERYV